MLSLLIIVMRYFANVIMNEKYVSDRPVSTNPGRKFTPEQGSVCDHHPDRLAVKKIQGETDSFGCEYFYVCQECLDAFEVEQEATELHCDFCRSIKGTRLRRDPSEGTCGAVYAICDACYAQCYK